MEDYENKKFIAKADSIALKDLLDMWAEEELKTGSLSNGTVENYLGVIEAIKKHPIAERRLKTVTAEHLQAFFDLLTFNPMLFVKLKKRTEDVDLFAEEDAEEGIRPLSEEEYEQLLKYLREKNPPAVLPVQIAHYTGLRIGEVCGLAWQHINLKEQCLTVRRSIRYNRTRHRNVIGSAKRKKVRIVDFGDSLARILKEARKEQLRNRLQYGELYRHNYYREVQIKNRIYYDYYVLEGTQEVPEDYREVSFVCLRPDGALELPSTLEIACRTAAKRLDGFDGFHFHPLRHTYTSDLLSRGTAPKDVQELLGHSDVSTTMNVYAHSSRKAKRDAARLLDQAVGNNS